MSLDPQNTPFDKASKVLQEFVVDDLENMVQAELIALLVDRLSEADLQEYAETMREFKLDNDV